MMPASPTSHLSKSSLFFPDFFDTSVTEQQGISLSGILSLRVAQSINLYINVLNRFKKKIKLLFHSSSQDKHGGEVSLGNRHCQRINWFSFTPTAVLWRIYFYKKDLFCVVPGLQTFASFSEVNTTEYNKDQFYLSSNNEY